MRWNTAHVQPVLRARCAWLNRDWPRAVRAWRATGRLAPAPEEVPIAA